MQFLIWASVGLVVAGPAGAALAVLTIWLRVWRSRRPPPPPARRVVLMLLLIELRSGMSVLASLQRTASGLPGYAELQRISRVATVSGLASTISLADETMRPVVAQLARAQRSGTSLTEVVRRMIDQDLSQMRADRLANARRLPVRLMIPVTLLMLPGVVLILYAPALIVAFRQLTGAWT